MSNDCEARTDCGVTKMAIMIVLHSAKVVHIPHEK
jgi:hypothetical protein